MAQEEYIHWPTNADIPLMLTAVDANGVGVPGLTPEVSIRRYKPVEGSGILDLYFWDPNTDAFVSTPVWIVVPPLDAVNLPGQYVYLWEQSPIGVEQVYIVSYRHTTPPVGVAMELHVITNEVYVPHTQPDPVIFGPDSIMGQLSDVKDGGTGDFDSSIHSLSKIGTGITQALGLLHHNSIVDSQQYDANGQLVAARLRVFDSAANIPGSPGGNEVVGLTQEYAIVAEYAGINNLTSYVLKQVQ